MFPGNHTNKGFSKPYLFQSAKQIILKFYTGGILLVHSTVFLKVAHHKTGELMPKRFIIVDTRNAVIMSDVTCIQLGILKVLCHNRTVQYKDLDAFRKYISQPELTATTVNFNPFKDHNSTVHPYQDHTATIPILQDHKIIHDIEDFKNMFPDSFNKGGSMPGNNPSYLIPTSHHYNTEDAGSP